MQAESPGSVISVMGCSFRNANQGVTLVGIVPGSPGTASTLEWWAWVLVAACLVASVGMFVESGPLTARGFGALAALFGQFGWYLAVSIVLVARPRV
jgi:hypothetical protein